MSWELLQEQQMVRWQKDKGSLICLGFVACEIQPQHSTHERKQAKEAILLGSRLLAALAFDHRRGIHHNIEDVLELVPQYFVVSISWYDIVTFLFPGSLQRRGLYNGSWLVCIWRTDFRTHDGGEAKGISPSDWTRGLVNTGGERPSFHVFAKGHWTRASHDAALSSRIGRNGFQALCKPRRFAHDHHHKDEYLDTAPVGDLEILHTVPGG